MSEKERAFARAVEMAYVMDGRSFAESLSARVIVATGIKSIRESRQKENQ